MRLSYLPFLLLIVPIIEISVFIAVGDQIGVFYTILMILVTAVIGSILLRIEGFRILGQIQKDMAEGKVPTKELSNGVMILIAGVLLLTPGFVTDAIGFLLFLSPVRTVIRAFVLSRIKLHTKSANTGFGAGFDGFQANHPKHEADNQNSPIVDLDEEAWTHNPDASSPWNNQPINGPTKPDKD
jgi:UPF0716 protein FxsA